MNKALFLLLVCYTASNSLFAQINAPVKSQPLSLADSLQYSRYVDSINVSSLYSAKRQRYLDSALQIVPSRARFWQQKAMPLFKQKKYEIGLRFLDSAVKYDANRYIDYRAFMKCIFQKTYRSAITDFKATKQLLGNGYVMDHTYDFYIGLCYLQLNELDSATLWIVSSINSQRKNTGAKNVHFLDLFYLGIVYYEGEQYDKAINTLDSCLLLYPNFSDAGYYRALCLTKLGRVPEALEQMRTAKTNFNEHYTINEDNVVYEHYPYQITTEQSYTGMISYLEGMGK